MRVLRGSHTHGLAGMAAMREMHGIRLLRPLLGIAPASLAAIPDWAGTSPGSRTRPTEISGRCAPGCATCSRTICTPARCRLCLSNRRGRAAPRAGRKPRPRPNWPPARQSGRKGSPCCRPAGSAKPPCPACCGPSAARLSARALANRRRSRPTPSGDGGRGPDHAGRPACQRLCWCCERKPLSLHRSRALPGTVWDNRFRLIVPRLSRSATIGKLGEDAPRFRSLTRLPSAVLRTLPAIRFGKNVAAVPHLGYELREDDVQMTVMFASAHSDPCFCAAGPEFGRRTGGQRLRGCYSRRLGGASCFGGDVGSLPHTM